MKKPFSFAALAFISLLMLLVSSMSSCTAVEISSQKYASFKEEETEYKLFLEYSGPTEFKAEADLYMTMQKMNQNEYKHRSDVDNDLKMIQKMMENVFSGCPMVRYVLRDRCGHTVTAGTIRPNKIV